MPLHGNGTIKNVLACQSMFGRKEAFHGSADTAVNTSQHVCMIYFTDHHNLFIITLNTLLHMHGFKSSKTVANSLNIHDTSTYLILPT